MRPFLGILSLVLLTCSSGLRADQPKEPEPELLPAPKAVAPGIIYVMPELPRPGTREVWQYYGVDNRGRFLNRVIYSPSGSFDSRTGMSYPWTTTRPTIHMPYALD